MKYWIITAALAALLLAGCTGNGAEQTAASTVETTAPDPGCYVPESTVELQTAGAVRQYSIEQADAYSLDFMEQDVVLFYTNAEGGASVNRFTGENCAVAALGELPKNVNIGSTALRVEERTLAYFNADDNSVVYLNDLFEESSRKKLPHTIMRQPVLGKDLYTVFYNVASEVYAADMNAGIARLVRQYGSDIPVVEQTLFNDSILLCSMVNSGHQDKVFISSVTGSPLGTDNGLKTIATLNQTYYLSRNDGIVGEILFGTKDSAPELLLPQEDGKVYPTLSLNGIAAETPEGDNGILLGFYDLSSGVRCSQVQLPGMQQILALDADDNAGYIWIVALNSAGEKVLLRWDVDVTAIEGGADHSCQRYTLENPDQEGVARCREKADGISKTYGVNVALLQDVKQPQEAAIQYEHQVEAIAQGLEKLEKVLSEFPEGFFAAMQDISGHKGINIGIVRGVSGATAEPEGLQYWLDGEAHIALVVGEDFEKAVLHEISHVLDTYIYTNSVLYDEWDEVNPAGFLYDENYETYLTRQDSPYLREGNQSFVDSYSMSFAKEDRARILECAMTEGNEAVFASSAMQNKLLRVCRAIRDAYDWKKDTRSFPWEQYLHKSIAYVEKKK